MGCCLLQDNRPVAFSSRALTDAETRYAQIEKELLAIVYACEKFSQFIYGRLVTVQSDHKPLEAIFMKPVAATTPCLQRMLLKTLKYQLKIVHTPGKLMYVADTLSRAYPSLCKDAIDSELAEDIDVIVHSVLHDLRVSSNRLDEFRRETATDPELSQLMEFLRNGFPINKSRLSIELQQFQKLLPEMYELDGLLLHNHKLVVPKSMRSRMLDLVHEGHLGVEKCRALARQCLYWPGLSRDIDNIISKCAVCNAHRKNQPAQPLQPHPIPFRPWEKLGSDGDIYKPPTEWDNYTG